MTRTEAQKHYRTTVQTYLRHKTRATNQAIVDAMFVVEDAYGINEPELSIGRFRQRLNYAVQCMGRINAQEGLR